MKTLWLVAAVLLPTVASAQEGALQLGVGVGRLWTDELMPLGHAWEISPRVGYFLTDHIAVELESPFGFGTTDTREAFSYLSVSPRVDLFGIMIPDRRVEPFLVAGPGLFYTTAADAPERFGSNYPNPNVDFLFNAGMGVLVSAGPLHLRSDVRVVGTIGSQYQTGPEATGVHVEWNLGVGLRVGGEKDTDGDKIPDGTDQCISEKEDKDGFQDLDGCPDPDNDGDSVLDAADLCPDTLEDLDGFQDGDGCPDPDNDQDTVADLVDKCPDVAGSPGAKGCPDADGDGIADDDDECVDEAGPLKANGCPDADGDRVPDYRDECPDKPIAEKADPSRSNGCPARVFATDKAIVILEVVNFKTGKTEILKDSFGLLDDVAAVLQRHPEVKKVEVAGHTDSDGDDAKNLTLSQGRAEAVVAYLVSKGVAAERLVAKGYGETVPVGDNATAAGKAENRRVEFTILEQDAPKARAKKPKKTP